MSSRIFITILGNCSREATKPNQTKQQQQQQTKPPTFEVLRGVIEINGRSY